MTKILPDSAMEQHIAVLGKTGAGKTYRLRGMVERLLDGEHRVCVLDPKGDWWGLRLAADGKHAGYAAVIFGGEHADVPINDRSGVTVGELVATGNRPCVIDMSTMGIGERTRFFMDFAASIFRHNRSPLWLVIDEVHNFAPQSGGTMNPEVSKMLHWANRIASEGRGKGLRIIMASQRPQKVHKDTLTCAETLIAMRVTHNLDRKAIKEWMDGAGKPEVSNKILGEIGSMPRGEAWVWSPEIGFLERDSSPKIKTYDSMKSPEGGSDLALKGWADIDLDDVRTRLAEVVKEADANDPKKLRARIAELERAKPGKAPAPVVDENAIARAVQRAEAARDQHWNAEMTRMGRALTGYTSRLTKIGELAHINGEAFKPGPAPVSTRPDPHTPRALLEPTKRPAPRSPANSTLGRGQLAILTAVASYPEGADHATIAVLTGYKETSRRTYLSDLSALGYIDNREPVRATAEGIAALGPDFEPLPTGRALREHWNARLPQGERRIFDAVLAAHPSPVTSEQLMEVTGYKETSVRTYVGDLSARKLIENRRGEIVASSTLFDGASA